MMIVGKWKPQQLEGESNARRFGLVSFKLRKHYIESSLYTDTKSRIKKEMYDYHIEKYYIISNWLQITKQINTL
jgi:hypothetical protein